MSKLHDFAQAVGADIKEIKTTLSGKADKGSEGITEERLTQAINQAKTDIIGGAPGNLIHSRKSLIKSVHRVAILTVVLSVK